MSNVITSARNPAVRIELPKTAEYVGADRWVLYSLADCELHAFVETDAQRRVQRLYWVQFESYLPSRPELHHTYDSPKHTTISGWDFYVDTWIQIKDKTSETGSDLEHILGLVRTKGYQMPDAMMCIRLVHLLDPQKRKELMVIYEEYLAPTGFTTSDLGKGGRAYDQWIGLADGLLKRAEKQITIEPVKQ